MARRLQHTFTSPAPDGVPSLWSRYTRYHAEADREYLVRLYLVLVRNIAIMVSRKLSQRTSLQDLIGAGCLGLLDAIERYDPKLGNKFEAFAILRIRGAMLDELRSLDMLPRGLRRQARQVEEMSRKLSQIHHRPPTDVELSEATGLTQPELDAARLSLLRGEMQSLDSMDYSAHANGRQGSDYPAPMVIPHDCADDARDKLTTIAQAIDALPERERSVMRLHYFEEMNFREIGKRIGYSESRVSQIHIKVRTRLRRKLRQTSLGNPVRIPSVPKSPRHAATAG